MAINKRNRWLSCAAVLIASGGVILVLARSPVDPVERSAGSAARDARPAVANSESTPDVSRPAVDAGRSPDDVARREAGSPAGRDLDGSTSGGTRNGAPSAAGGGAAPPGVAPGEGEPGEAAISLGESRPENLPSADKFDTLVSIAEYLADDPAWMSDPPPELEAAVTNLVDSTLWLSGDPKSTDFLEISVDDVLQKAASTLEANADAGGAQLAQDARTAIADGRFYEAHELVREMVDSYYQ